VAYPQLDTIRSIEDLKERKASNDSSMAELNEQFDGLPFPDDARDTYASLRDENEEIDRRVKELQARHDDLARMAEDKARHADVGGVFATAQRNDREEMYEWRDLAPEGFDRPAGQRVDSAVARALFITEKLQPAHPASKVDSARAQIEGLIRKDTTGEMALRVIRYGSPAYERAFGKMVMGKPLSNEETRQLAISDAALPAPIALDPTLILTSDGSANPFRAISRVVTVSGNVWRGVSTDGVSASYDDELTEVSDDTPTLTGPELNVEKAQAFVPFSIEAGEDWPGLRGELARAFADAKDVLETTKFLSGSGHGSHEPEGLLTGLGGGQTVTTASSGTYVEDDLFSLVAALPERYQNNATIVMTRAVAAISRQFSTLIDIREGTPDQLLGYPTRYVTGLTTLPINAADIVAVIGDFNRFVIVDRTGMSVELIPHLFGTGANRPIGARALYCYWRNTSGVVDANAFRELKVHA